MKADVILESTTVVVVVNLTELFNLFQGLGLSYLECFTL